jgi:hypothetical protein
MINFRFYYNHYKYVSNRYSLVLHTTVAANKSTQGNICRDKRYPRRRRLTGGYYHITSWTCDRQVRTDELVACKQRRVGHQLGTQVGTQVARDRDRAERGRTDRTSNNMHMHRSNRTLLSFSPPGNPVAGACVAVNACI